MHNVKKIEQAMIAIALLLKEEVEEEKNPRVKLTLQRALIEQQAAHVSFVEATIGGADFSQEEFKEYKARLRK